MRDSHFTNKTNVVRDLTAMLAEEGESSVCSGWIAASLVLLAMTQGRLNQNT